MSAAVSRDENKAAAPLSLLSWRPGSGKFNTLAAALLLMFGAYGVAYLVTSFVSGSPHSFGDAFGLWSWARFVDTHPVAEIYDPAALHAAQIALGMDPHDEFPFAYPPIFLLLLRPLGFLPCAVAILALIAGTLPLYLWATVGRAWRSPALLTAIVAPTTTITIVAGQSAFLSSALLIGGFRLVDRRPIVAGMLFGLLSFKPQFGLLVPVALVAAGQWRTIAAAVATLCVTIVLTCLLFGPTIWLGWFAALPAYSRQFTAESSAILHLMPTILATLRQFGVSISVAGPAQWFGLAVVAAMVWVAFRSGPAHLAAAGLFAAGFLATPYAFAYDMPTVTAAVLWVIAERGRSGGSFGSGAVLVLIMAMVAPITLPVEATYFPLALVSLILLFAVILYRIRELRSRPLAPMTPGLPVTS